MAAKLAPPNQLNLVSGAALQMQRELVWFEEVKKIVQPPSIRRQTRKEKHHGNYSQVSMKTFSVPGGTSDNTGEPNFLKETAFLFFAIADGVALVSSSTSILMFLFILTSRYAEVSLSFCLIPCSAGSPESTSSASHLSLRHGETTSHRSRSLKARRDDLASSSPKEDYGRSAPPLVTTNICTSHNKPHNGKKTNIPSSFLKSDSQSHSIFICKQVSILKMIIIEVVAS
ncbi:hypothetical protein ACLB2K_029305 [Fragaria x ananassa]